MPEARKPPGDRLLILSCSRCKRPDQGLLPAIERYDGPAFQVLRRFLREVPSEAPDVRIISAEYGLIPQGLPIANYDRVMTPSRARELRPRVLAALTHLASVRSPQETFVSASRVYLSALDAEEKPLFLESAKVGKGTIGGKLSELQDWLWGDSSRLRYNSAMPTKRGRSRIRGIELSLTAEQVAGIARQALMEGWGNPERYESWYVAVDSKRVAPKWLVSRLTGLPVSSFHSGDARRVLNQLGIEVSRL